MPKYKCVEKCFIKRLYLVGEVVEGDFKAYKNCFEEIEPVVVEPVKIEFEQEKTEINEVLETLKKKKVK